MKRKISKDEENMDAMQRKSENGKELNHQGEFDHCSETWSPHCSTPMRFGPHPFQQCLSLFGRLFLFPCLKDKQVKDGNPRR